MHVQENSSVRKPLAYLSGYGLLTLVFCGLCSFGVFSLIGGQDLLTLLMIPAPEGSFDQGTTSPPDSSGWGRIYKTARTSQEVLAFYEEILPTQGWSIEQQSSDIADYCLKVHRRGLKTAYIEVNNKRDSNTILNESLVSIGTNYDLTGCEAP